MTVIQPGRISLRHIVRDPVGTFVLGKTFAAQPREGVNGPNGWQSGTYDRRLNDSGEATIKFPNGAGGDGRLHRDRFAVIASGRPTPSGTVTSYTGGSYRPGDEWLEVWRTQPGTQAGTLLFVGTPIAAKVTRSTIELRLVDALWLTRKARETGFGFHRHAPRDAIEEYLGVWQSIVADDFADAEDYVSSATEATSPNGLWRYKLGAPSPTRPRVVRLATDGYVQGIAEFNAATARFRAEVQFHPVTVNNIGADAGLYIFSGASRTIFQLEDWADPADQFGYARVIVDSAVFDERRFPLAGFGKYAPFALAIEGDGRWLYYTVNGQLIATFPNTLPNAADYRVQFGPTGTGTVVDVDMVVARRRTPALLTGADKGDLRLPGTPTAGGLVAEFYTDVDLVAWAAPTDAYRHTLAPTAAPYARRLDDVIAYGPSADWMPVGPPDGERWSVRWTGSIYLDLEGYNYRLRLADLDDRARLWVGKTRHGEQAIDDWTAGHSPATTSPTPYLRTHLGTEEAGWYPLVIEFGAQTGPSSITFQIERSDAPGTWNIVPAEGLSPLGIYPEHVRFESHYDQWRKLLDTYALQMTCEPRSLESGEFPGQAIPRVREGRDTEYVLDNVEAVEVTLDIDAQEVSDALTADAQGIADKEQAVQITGEGFNFPQLAEHLMVVSEHDSLSDIANPELLQQRLDSMIVLRGSPWEEVNARPAGSRQLVDSFPLTGELAEFAWLPGDSVRLRFDDIGVRDLSPRQIMSVSWPIVPGGIGRPSVSFRQRPRSLYQTIRDLMRKVLDPRRNYQGQMVSVQGSPGSTLTPVAPDGWSRLALPMNLGDVVRVELVIMYMSATPSPTPFTLQINGTSTTQTYDRAGRYDITEHLAQLAGQPYMTARLDGGGGTSYTHVLEALVRR